MRLRLWQLWSLYLDVGLSGFELWPENVSCFLVCPMLAGTASGFLKVQVLMVSWSLMDLGLGFLSYGFCCFAVAWCRTLLSLGVSSTLVCLTYSGVAAVVVSWALMGLAFGDQDHVSCG